MTTAEFKKIARTLKEVYKQIEAEALAEGISLLSPEYDQLIAIARERVLEAAGYTLQEYREAKAKVSGFSQADLVDHTERTAADIDAALKAIEQEANRHIPTQEEIEAIAKRVAEAVVKPPQIINQIVKETTIEKPKIVKETVKIKEEYNDKPLREEIKKVKEKVDSIKIPEAFNPKGLEEKFEAYVAQSFKKNIDTLGMPDFRKLAMGLQEQIDSIERSVAINFIIDGGGSAITTGVKGFVDIPYDMTITGWKVFADQTGDIVVDVWKDIYANFPPVVGDSIAGSEKPTLSSSRVNSDLDLTTWRKEVSTGDILVFNVDSASTVQRVTVSIIGVKR
jgi:hypothetical protein